jgi:hypothetical protein
MSTSFDEIDSENEPIFANSINSREIKLAEV